MEIEAKFAVPDRETFQQLKALDRIAGLPLSPGRTERVKDVYLDTADRRLLAAGYACRQRIEGDSVRVTLKALGTVEGAIHRREEQEIPFPSSTTPPIPLREWPANPLRDQVHQLIGEAPLIPLFTLQQRRILRTVQQGERVIAEISLDDVELIVDDEHHRYLDLEVELAPQGSEGELNKLAAYLQEEWGLPPEPQSKFQRGEALRAERAGDTDTPDRPGLETGDSMAKAARKTLLFHFRQMVRHEPGTRRGEDIEELHDMRVATRRMRAAFRVFEDYLDMEQMAPFLQDLRRTGRALGVVRDLDVFWAKTAAYLESLPPEQRSGLAPLRAAWAARREEAQKEMVAYLDSTPYRRFRETFGPFLQQPGAGSLPAMTAKKRPRPHRLRNVVPAIIYQKLATVWAYDDLVTRQEATTQQLHRLRIEVKRVRYTIEFFQEVLGPEAEDIINLLKGLQDHLGDLQDAAVACQLIRDFLKRGRWKGKKSAPSHPIDAPGVEAYLAVRQEEIEDLRARFPERWEQFQRSDLRQWVAAALQPLSSI